MSRPPFEVADIVRAAGDTFRDKNRSWLTGLHRKVLSAIEQCRTAALGGHKDRCPRCAYQAISYNSCGNRHCPKCQTNARDRWLAARQRELLPVPYVHVVFTLPHQLASLTLYNKRLMRPPLFICNSVHVHVECAIKRALARSVAACITSSSFFGAYTFNTSSALSP